MILYLPTIRAASARGDGGAAYVRVCVGGDSLAHDVGGGGGGGDAGHDSGIFVRGEVFVFGTRRVLHMSMESMGGTPTALSSGSTPARLQNVAYLVSSHVAIVVVVVVVVVVVCVCVWGGGGVCVRVVVVVVVVVVCV
jgi:hypothetical protein